MHVYNRVDYRLRFGTIGIVFSLLPVSGFFPFGAEGEERTLTKENYKITICTVKGSTLHGCPSGSQSIVLIRFLVSSLKLASPIGGSLVS